MTYDVLLSPLRRDRSTTSRGSAAHRNPRHGRRTSDTRNDTVSSETELFETNEVHRLAGAFAHRDIARIVGEKRKGFALHFTDDADSAGRA